jgi:PIN domain nuclease of toxin-antitoxin system
MTRAIVDTQALLWWLFKSRTLPVAARALLADPSNELLVSAVSVWEIAIKRSLGKLEAPEELPEVLAGQGFVFLAISPWHAWRVATLPRHHTDPFDRLLIAQALTEGIPIVTGDAAFAPYGVGVRW